MSTLAPAIPIEELRKKLEDLNIEPRFIRGILRDVEFKALLYKNHQLCYLHEYAKNFQDVKLSINQLSIIFQMNPRTVSKSICKGSQDLKPKNVFIDNNLDSNHITYSVSRKVSHMTILTCVSAAGDALTPLLITKHTIKDSLWETGLRQDEDVMIRIRDPPYISKELFEEYINVVFIPYLNSVREKINATSSEALLMMDSCSVHCDKSI